MNQPLLSILICHIYERAGMLASLLRNLEEQIERNDAKGLIEILVCADNKERTTGDKRNELLQRAAGKFVVAADDDDKLPVYYISEILKGAITDCDTMAISGIMTTNGTNAIDWYISKDNDYCRSKNEKGFDIFLRYPNHITPIRSEIAKQFKFPNKMFGEDYEWATAIHHSGLIKKEYKIERHPMYIYDFKTVK